MQRLVVAGVIAVLATITMSQPRAQTSSEADESRVRAVVSAFGNHLNDVSVMAPRKDAAAAIDRAYAAYVAANLLSAWKRDPKMAPGKRTSSPFPARIDIASVKTTKRDAFVVTGKVILLTAKEQREGGVFASNPVTI